MYLSYVHRKTVLQCEIFICTKTAKYVQYMGQMCECNERAVIEITFEVKFVAT